MVFVSAASFAPAVVSPASADVRAVNCDSGRKISTALRMPAGRVLVINVRGTCTENVVINRDNVTIQKDPLAPGSPVLNALNADEPTIKIDGARNVRIKDLTVNGGMGAVVGTNGAVFDVLGTGAAPAVTCVIQGGTRYGVAASYGATATVDGCLVQNVAPHATFGMGDGILVINNASLSLTNSTVKNNARYGVLVVRGGSARVGQDRTGGPTVWPVTVEGNVSTGIVFSEGATGVVYGATVNGMKDGTSTMRGGIFVGRASSAEIGGPGGTDVTLNKAVTVSNIKGIGITVDAGHATILGSTITNNTGYGIVVRLGGNARIGFSTSNTYVGNQITENAGGGVQIAAGSSAWLGGNTIDANKPATAPANSFIYGVEVNRASAILVGGNTVSNHVSSGIVVYGGGNARIGDTGLAGSLSAVNTISGNGNGGALGALGGVYAFQGGVVEIRKAVIEDNFGRGVAAYEGSTVELRDGTLVQNNRAAPDQSGNDFDAGHGVIAGLQSTLRLRDGDTQVIGNDGHGVHLFSGSGADFRVGTAYVSVTGNTGRGLNCGGASYYSGDVRGVSVNAGGGNDDPNETNPPRDPNFGSIPGCNRF